MAIGRLPKRATSQPARGREDMRPTGRPSSTPPSEALSRCRCCWILGIRDAQEEKQRPARKKKALTEMRFSLRGGRERGCLMASKVKLLEIPFFEDQHVMGHVA